MTSINEMPPALTLSASDRVMIFAPHPDDESLGNAALIQHACAVGARVRVVFVTDGDNNPWPQRYLERRWVIDADCRHRWGMRRRGESTRAIQILGLHAEDAVFFGLPDQGLPSLWKQRDTRTLSLHVEELKTFQPTLIVVPSNVDNHPDHTASFAIVQEALKIAAITPSQWAYLIHRRWFYPEATGFAFQLTAEQKAKKLAAIECHETQLSLSRGRFCAYASDQEIFSPVHV
jgi:LmbE family N-acetylglucosaminyl deacetylase